MSKGTGFISRAYDGCERKSGSKVKVEVEVEIHWSLGGVLLRVSSTFTSNSLSITSFPVSVGKVMDAFLFVALVLHYEH